MARTFLTDGQRTIIRQGISDGLSYSQVASQAECKTQTAKSYARRVKLQSPKTLLWDKQQALRKDGKRLCPKCYEILSFDQFRLNNGDVKYSYCLSCCRLNENERLLTPSLRFRKVVNGAKSRAKEKGVQFCLAITDIENLWEKQNGLCFYTREPLTLEPNNRRTISLDRIKPSLGYVLKNVVLCCDIINKMKWDMNDEEMLEWCQRVVNTASK